MKKEEDYAPTFYPVKDKQDLEKIKGYEIEGIREDGESGEGKTTTLFLKKNYPDGKVKNRLLMIVSNGNRYITDEY